VFCRWDVLSPEGAALRVAADEYPALRAAEVEDELDRLASAVRIARDAHENDRRIALLSCVYGELGFCLSDDEDPRANYVNDVLSRRRGSPVALAVVLSAIGHRVGVPVRPVAFPGHFLARIGASYVDPSDGGHPLSVTRLVELATDTLGDRRLALLAMRPVGGRSVALRLLLNLHRIHRDRGDHGRALLTCDRLFELTGAAFHLADRGAHALKMGAVNSAVADFQAYLAADPRAPDACQVRELLARARNLECTVN
jgi:regulator of sirC expression with transglutaminase-like and TPR domain